MLLNVTLINYLKKKKFGFKSFYKNIKNLIHLAKYREKQLESIFSCRDEELITLKKNALYVEV